MLPVIIKLAVLVMMAIILAQDTENDDPAGPPE